MRTQEQSIQIPYLISTLFAEVSHARASQYAENEAALKMQEELCSLRSLGLPPLKDLHFCYLKMFPDSFHKERECILTDILETDVPEKYYLSQKQAEKLLYKLSPAEKGTESIRRTESP